MILHWDYVFVCANLVAAKRSTFCMQLMLVMLHLVCVGFLFIFYGEFMDKFLIPHW